MAKAVDPFELNSAQLYKLAAFAHRAQPGKFRMKPPDDNGTVVAAIVPTNLAEWEQPAANGWLYTAVNRAGDYDDKLLDL